LLPKSSSLLKTLIKSQTGHLVVKERVSNGDDDLTEQPVDSFFPERQSKRFSPEIDSLRHAFGYSIFCVK